MKMACGTALGAVGEPVLYWFGMNDMKRIYHKQWVIALFLLGTMVLLAACGRGQVAASFPASVLAESSAIQPATAAVVTAATTATLPAPATAVPAPVAASLPAATATPAPAATATAAPPSALLPDFIERLTVDYLRRQSYPGSPLVIEQTLAAGSTYNRYYASYYSEGLKQYGLLTVPRGEKPASGWPVIIFNHGYIPPAQYKTTERYVAYVDGFAARGYIVFRPDYRGHDQSEGRASGAYGSPDYVVDVLNAVATLKQYPDADPQRIGMWGHSMGGWITLRAMVTDPDIKAGVIWGGVVAPYEDLLTKWRRSNRPASTPDPSFNASSARRWRSSLGQLLSENTDNSAVWRALSPNYYLADLTGPIQLHHTTGDEEVPVEFSQILYEQGQQAGMPIELVTYPGDNHNISGNFNTAMSQSVAFFDRWLRRPINLAQASTPAVFTGNGVANLRAGPSTAFAVVGQMPAGASLPLLGSNTDRTWWQVQSASGPAWVSGAVTLAARTAAVPVVD